MHLVHLINPNFLYKLSWTLRSSSSSFSMITNMRTKIHRKFLTTLLPATSMGLDEVVHTLLVSVWWGALSGAPAVGLPSHGTLGQVGPLMRVAPGGWELTLGFPVRMCGLQGWGMCRWRCGISTQQKLCAIVYCMVSAI